MMTLAGSADWMMMLFQIIDDGERLTDTVISKGILHTAGNAGERSEWLVLVELGMRNDSFVVELGERNESFVVELLERSESFVVDLGERNESFVVDL